VSQPHGPLECHSNATAPPCAADGERYWKPARVQSRRGLPNRSSWSERIVRIREALDAYAADLRARGQSLPPSQHQVGTVAT